MGIYESCVIPSPLEWDTIVTPGIDCFTEVFFKRYKLSTYLPWAPQLPSNSSNFDSSLTAPTLLYCFLPQAYRIKTYQAKKKTIVIFLIFSTLIPVESFHPGRRPIVLNRSLETVKWLNGNWNQNIKMQAQIRWVVISEKEGLSLSQNTGFPVAYQLFLVTAHSLETWTKYWRKWLFLKATHQQIIKRPMG